MAEGLDAKVWSELPAEILERVLRWLPFSTLCKFRVVCKHWNTLPTVRAEDPYILDIPCNTRKDYVTCLRYCCLYSPAANTWDFINLSFLPQRMTQLSSCPYYWTPQIERFCSNGGLLCVWGKLLERDLRYYFSDIVPHYTLVVCNPLTKGCKLLPQFDFTYQSSVDLVMKRESSGEYKIFAVALAYTGEPGINLRHCMYESASGSWKLLLDLKRDCSDVTLLRYCSIIFDGVYYCISGGGRQPYDLYAYDIKQNSWVAAGVRMKLNPKTTHVLFVVSNGHLLLMASILEEKLYFSINKVDLRGTETIFSSAGYVSLPANFTWKRGVALAYRDSIILASESKCRFMAVDLLSLSADLKELKSITPTSVIPTSESCMRRLSESKAKDTASGLSYWYMPLTKLYFAVHMKASSSGKMPAIFRGPGMQRASENCTQQKCVTRSCSCYASTLQFRVLLPGTDLDSGSTRKRNNFDEITVTYILASNSCEKRSANHSAPIHCCTV